MTASPRPLQAEHSHAAIRQRLARPTRPSLLRDAVLGGIDGGVTTFAVVSGALGGGFSPMVVVVLGFANLLADGLSMAVGNYLGTKSQREALELARREEERHIDLVPEGEREEVRQLFAAKGFEGEVLDRIVATITEDRRLWVDTMLTEELGLTLQVPDPLRAAAATFVAFLVVGLVPLVPFLVPGLSVDHAFLASGVATAVAFVLVGLAKGRVLERPLLRSGLETLLTGGGAAAVAWTVGAWLRQAFGA
ncbi:MAG: VIT1/CCC1 transporter family protein [Alphaproteobacteria bacterium]|nr:VIT1/CCC1 transporter family protein [Alphaproteobacteria bacterium]